MGASRKGKRTLVVDGVRYSWLARGTDDGGIDVSVATDAAFVPGQRGQWLHFPVPYDSLHVAHEGSWSLHQRARVTPGLVRRAIEVARGSGPAFTGRAGEPDVRLSAADVGRLLADSPLTRIRGDLRSAELSLATLVAAAEDPERAGRLTYETEVLIGHWPEIAHMEGLWQDSSGWTTIDGWFERNAEALARIVPHVQAAARAIEETAVKSWPTWKRTLRRCYERRSALAVFLDHARRAGLAQFADHIDTASLDACLRTARAGEGGREVAPPGTPATHWWWTWRDHHESDERS